MIALSPEAEAQLEALIAHYEALGRVEASINLLSALERARTRISQTPEAGLPAPRPYPALAKADHRGHLLDFLQLDEPTGYLRCFLCDGRYSQPSLRPHDLRLRPRFDRGARPRKPASQLRRAKCDRIFCEKITGEHANRPKLNETHPAPAG
jgi:plasmid stabilization system protein ParE